MSDWKTFEEILPAIGQLMAEDPERGYERVERRWKNGKSKFWPAKRWGELFDYADDNKYRIKPRTVTRTVTYPEPLRERPKHGESYWTIHGPTSTEGDRPMTWEGDQFDQRAFKRGMCFATREDSRAAHVALFGGEE